MKGCRAVRRDGAALVAGLLAPERAARLRAHLARCQSCARLVGAMEDAYRDLPAADVEPGLRGLLVAAAALETARVHAGRAPRMRLVAAAAAVAAVLVVVGAGLVVLRHGPARGSVSAAATVAEAQVEPEYVIEYAAGWVQPAAYVY